MQEEKSMRKRKGWLSLLMACVLTMGCGLTALAAESGSGSVSAGLKVVGPVMVNGEATGLKVVMEKLDEKTIEEGVKAAQEDIKEGAQILQVADVHIEGEDYDGSPVTITFQLNGISSGQVIYVYHQKKDGTWEKIVPDNVGDGTVKVTFQSLSPVIFVLDTVASGMTAGLTDEKAQSPKTGDQFDTVATAAVLCLIGMLVCAGVNRRKQKQI